MTDTTTNTTIPDYPRGITFEQVWAGLMETRKRQEETDRLMKETFEKFDKRMKDAFEKADKRMQDADKRMREAEEQRQEADKQRQEAEKRKYEAEKRKYEAEKRKQEAEKRKYEAEKRKQEAAEKRRQEEADRRRRELDERMGFLSNRFGELAEHLVAPGIVERFNKLGYHFNNVATRGCKVYGENGKVKAEIDILLENGETTIAVEVKSKTSVKDVDHHIKRLEILREFRKKLPDNRKILGAIACAIFGEKEKEATRRAGLYVIEQSGDTMKIDMPPDFIPREW